MQPCVEAYLDIETTGLSPTYDEITVVGIHLCSETDAKFIQLVGRDATADNILEGHCKGKAYIPHSKTPQ